MKKFILAENSVFPCHVETNARLGSHNKPSCFLRLAARMNSSFYAIDFSLVLMIKPWASLKVYLLSLIVQRCNCLSIDAIEC